MINYLVQCCQIAVIAVLYSVLTNSYFLQSAIDKNEQK